MSKVLTAVSKPFLDLVAHLYSHYERQGLKAAEAAKYDKVLSRFRGNVDQIHSFFLFDLHTPPKDIYFDAWGRSWNPSKDVFEWHRFPNCYMAPETGDISIGASSTIRGLPEYAARCRVEWWCTIPTPPQFPQEDKVQFDEHQKP